MATKAKAQRGYEQRADAVKPTKDDPPRDGTPEDPRADEQPEGSDVARRVHPDTDGYQYEGDDSDAEFVEHGNED